MALRLNPITGRLDLVDQVDVSSASTTTTDNIEIDSSGVMWFWIGGHRYKLTGTLDDPVFSGTANGLLLALSTL